MSYRNPKWWFVSDFYEPLESVKGWKKCKFCGEFPRIWIFDNGSYARCLCGYPERYTAEHEARSESILSVLKRTGSVREYTRDNLRLAWNKWVETGIRQNKLGEGQW